MSRPPSALRNLGPATDAAFARVGITTADQLIAHGVDAAYGMLLANGARPHFAFFWAIAFAIQDRPWSDLGREEKAALRARFEAVKAAAAAARPDPHPDAALEAELDRLGVGRQPTISRPAKK